MTAPTQIPRSSTSWPRRHPLWSALLTVLVVVLFIGAVTDQDTPDSAATSDSVAPDRESSPAKTSPEPETKVDDPGPTPAEVTAPGLVGQPLKRARANLARSSLGVQVERGSQPKDLERFSSSRSNPVASFFLVLRSLSLSPHPGRGSQRHRHLSQGGDIQAHQSRIPRREARAAGDQWP